MFEVREEAGSTGTGFTNKTKPTKTGTLKGVWCLSQSSPAHDDHRPNKVGTLEVGCGWETHTPSVGITGTSMCTAVTFLKVIGWSRRQVRAGRGDACRRQRKTISERTFQNKPSTSQRSSLFCRPSPKLGGAIKNVARAKAGSVGSRQDYGSGDLRRSASKQQGSSRKQGYYIRGRNVLRVLHGRAAAGPWSRGDFVCERIRCSTG